MDYEQFREQLADEVQKNLYEKGDVEVNITFNHVEKMNESITHHFVIMFTGYVCRSQYV